MSESLQEAMALVARITMGELSGVGDADLVEHEDEDFADLMAGLLVLAADTKEVMEERETQTRLAHLRTEL